MPTDPHHDPHHDQPCDQVGEQVGEHPVLELWDELEALAGKLAVATTWSMSGPQSRASVAVGDRVLAVLESAWLGLVRDLDSRPDAVAGARAGHVARTFLMHALHRSPGQAGADVRAARALDPDRTAVEGGLPELGAAFAAGAVSRQHMDAAERVMSQLPSGPARAVGADGKSGAQRVEEFLAEQARVLDPVHLGRLGRQVLARLDPDAEGGYDADAYRRRCLSFGVAPDGMTVGRFALPAAQGAALRAVLDAFSAPQAASQQPGEDGQPVLITDERTRQQRQADALIAMARAAAEARAAAGAEPAQVTILTDLDQLAAARATTDPHAADTGSDAGSAFRPGTGAAGKQAVGLAHCHGHGPISTAALALLACDARLRAVVLDQHGAVLHLGRAQRLASKAQRIALAARDRGCVIPGCAAPAAICDVHHVTWWSQGGPTDIDTMAMVCPRHHTDIHHGVWHLKMRHGSPGRDHRCGSASAPGRSTRTTGGGSGTRSTTRWRPPDASGSSSASTSTAADPTPALHPAAWTR